MSEFNMPPGVSTNDIPGNNPTPPGIPPAFVDAAKEAGERLEGWIYRADADCMVLKGIPHMSFRVYGSGLLRIRFLETMELPEIPNLSVVDAFRIAGRIARALTGEAEGENTND